MRPRRTRRSTSDRGCRRGRVFLGEDPEDSHGGRARHGPPEHLLGALVETAAGNGCGKRHDRDGPGRYMGNGKPGKIERVKKYKELCGKQRA